MIKKHTKELSSFCRQLSVMLKAGLPLLRSLEVLRGQPWSRGFQRVIFTVWNDLKRGHSFSKALGAHPKIFPHLIVNLVEVGEKTGTLDLSLERAAHYLEEAASLTSKIKAALTYPLFVLGVSLLSLIVLIGYFVPAFSSIFGDLNLPLPYLTLLIMDMGDFIFYNFYFILGAIVFLSLALPLAVKTERGALILDGLKLKLPVIGKITRALALSRISGTLEILLAGGVPILGALGATSLAAGNLIYQKGLETACHKVRAGESIAVSLEGGLFSPMVKQMVAVGEATGNLPGVLKPMANFYKEEAENSIKTLTSLVEPLATIIVGLAVALIVVAMFLPLIQIVGKLQQ